jgi:outer membrane usher protein
MPTFRSRRTKWRALVLFAGIASIGQASAAEPATWPARPETPDPDSPRVAFVTTGASQMWLDARVNGVKFTEANRYLSTADGKLFAPASALAQWRVRVPQAEVRTIDGQAYVPLDAIAGLRHSIDDASQQLIVEANPGAFVANTMPGIEAPPIALSPIAPGAFLNYDAHAMAQSGADSLSGLVECGVFNGFGVGSTAFLGMRSSSQDRVVRLDTTWIRDLPDRMETLRLGDGATRPGAWGQTVRFGGVQWGTNFATRPDFVPFVLPSARGQAAVPSTVDLVVDNARLATTSVPPGPFELNRIPVVTGAGEVQVAVRDLLGRQTIVTQPYYVSPALLREGQADYSVEAGWTRADFGLASNDYREPFAAATYRVGVADDLTVEGHGEFSGRQQTAGFSASNLWSDFGVANFSVAESRNEHGEVGALAAVGFERQSRQLSFAAQTQWTIGHFARLGLPADRPAPRQLTVARVGFSPGGRDSLAAGFLLQDDRGSGRTKALTVSYSTHVARDVFVSVFGVSTLAGRSSTTAGMVLTMPLGGRTAASAGWTRQAGHDEEFAQLQRNVTTGSSVGYRLLAGQAGGAHEEAGVVLQTDVAVLGAEAGRAFGVVRETLDAAGGVAAVDGGVRFSRRIDDSFAVVKVGGYPDVRVYVENQEVARTDAAGVAFLPQLRPYQRNQVRIDEHDLPLEAEVDTLGITVTPTYRSAALAEFPVRRGDGAVLQIVLDDGAPLPAGATVRVLGREAAFPVAMRGEAYVTGLERHTRLVAQWNGQMCELAVALPDQGGPLPHIGPLACIGVRP